MPKPSPLFTLSLSATLLMLGVGMIVALLPQRIHAMTGSLESVGLVASVFAFAYLLAQLPVSAFSDRLGPKRILVIGYLTCGVSGLLYVASDTAGGIFLGRVVQGLGEAPIWALGPAILSLAYPTTKGRVIGIYNAAIHIGLTAGPLLGLLIAPNGQGDAPFLVFAGLCFAAGVVVFLFLRVPSVPVSQQGTDGRQIVVLLRKRQVVILLCGVLLYGAGYGAFLTVLPISLAATHGLGTTAISLNFVLFYAAISISQVAAGAASDRIGRRGFLIWGMALASTGLVALPVFPGLSVFCPLAVASIGLGMFCVASITELNARAPDDLKGAASGSYYLFWAAGYVLGPWAIGAMAGSNPLFGFTLLAGMFALITAASRSLRG